MVVGAAAAAGAYKLAKHHMKNKQKQSQGTPASASRNTPKQQQGTSAGATSGKKDKKRINKIFCDRLGSKESNCMAIGKAGKVAKCTHKQMIGPKQLTLIISDGMQIIRDSREGSVFLTKTVVQIVFSGFVDS